jgi:hypothetical protein
MLSLHVNILILFSKLYAAEQYITSEKQKTEL